MLIEKFKIKRTFKNKFLIKFDIIPGDNQNVSDYDFRVSVSYHENSDFRNLNVIDGEDVLNNHIEYIDDFREYNMNRVRYYKVGATEKTTGSLIYESPLMYIGAQTDGIIETIRYSEELLNDLYVGTPCVLLRRKLHEKLRRCPDCWDRVTKQVRLTHCTTCFGTSFVGGYYSSINVQVAINNVMRLNVPEDVGENIYNNELQGRFPNFPIVKPKDIIIDTSTGKRFIISNMVKITKLPRISNYEDQMSGEDMIASQIYQLVEFASNDIAYEINPDEIPAPDGVVSSYEFSVTNNAFKPAPSIFAFGINAGA